MLEPFLKTSKLLLYRIFGWLFTSLSLFVLVAVFTPYGDGLLSELTFLKSWWLITLALSLICIGFTITTPWRLTGIQFSSLLVGTASQLSFTESHWFQAISVQQDTIFEQLCSLAIAAQLIIGLGSLLTPCTRRTFLSSLTCLSYTKLALLLIIMASLSMSAMPYIGSRDIFAFSQQLLYSYGFWLINLCSIIAIAFNIPTSKAAQLAGIVNGQLSLLNPVDQARSLDNQLPYWVALWVLLASALICWFGFERLPHVEDEVVYLFQSKYLLYGQLSVDAPVAPKAFEFYLLQLKDGRWFTITLPGWPLVLALGTAIDASWLVNPILAAISILLAHKLLLQLEDRATANIAILLMGVSPWLLATSASLMNHTLTLVLTLGAWVSLYHAQSRQSAIFALVAGLLAGFLFFVRPFDGFIMGTMTGFWTLFLLKRRSGFTLIASYALGCVLVGGLIFPFNLYMTGDLLLTPQNDYGNQLWGEGTNRLGFGEGIGPPKLWGNLDLYLGHSPLEALVNTQHNSYMTQFELFGWGIGSLLFVIIHFLWGAWNNFQRCMLVFILAFVTGYSLYWFSGGFYIGPRYWFMMFFPFIVLTTAGIKTLYKSISNHQTVSIPGTRIGFTVLVLVLVTIIAFIPWRSGTRYHEYRGYHNDYRELLTEHPLNGSVIFLNTKSEEDFGSAFIFAEPNFSASAPVFAYDLGLESNIKIAATMSDRPIYYVSGRQKDKNNVTIIEGPISYKELLNRRAAEGQ